MPKYPEGNAEKYRSQSSKDKEESKPAEWFWRNVIVPLEKMDLDSETINPEAKLSHLGKVYDALLNQLVWAYSKEYQKTDESVIVPSEAKLLLQSIINNPNHFWPDFEKVFLLDSERGERYRTQVLMALKKIVKDLTE